MLKKPIFIAMSLAYFPSMNTLAEETNLLICDAKITKMERSVNHRVTIKYYNTNTSQYELLAPHLSFILPASLSAFNFIKTAYLYNKPLCVEYKQEGTGDNQINHIKKIHDHSL